MKSRFAAVKRPLLALTALVMLVGMTNVMPSHAVAHNNLSFSQTMGRIRVRPVFTDRSGNTLLQSGDPNIAESNPNRTVGDVPFIAGDLFPSPCDPGPTDCLRTLGINDVSVNPSAADGHAHYHVGDTSIVVNEVAGFRAGDTILIGSPYCNLPNLGITCKKFIQGFGLVNEQPFGEVGHVVGGDVALGDHGPGVLQLAEPLSLDNSANPSSSCITYALPNPCAHAEGEQVLKLATPYQGQSLRVDISHADLLNCTIPPLVVCNPNGVTVNAEFIPPQGSHNPSFPRRPLALDRDHQNGPFISSVAATCPCGAGFTSFYIPSNITGTATIGNSFSVDSPDTWYTVIITARDAVTNGIVADGLVRFKPNPVNIVSLRSDRETDTAPGTYFPTQTVTITGKVRDNSSAAALNRPVEDLVVDGDITKPDGSVNHYQTRSCADTDPTTSDVCGGNVFLGPGDQHGNFQFKIGGLQGLYLAGDPLGTGSDGITCNNEGFPILGCILDPVFSALDTLQTGTYDVVATLRGLIPAVTATDQFNVEFP